jgi:RNA polymerase sigma factor for flagellar operon FliA
MSSEREVRTSPEEEPVEAGDASLLDCSNVGGLFAANFSMAKGIVSSLLRRIRPGLLEHDDCMQAAALALLQSAERFAPKLGVPFRVFARPRIRGAIFDLLRSELRARGSATEPTVRVRERSTHLDEDESGDEFDRYIALVVDLGFGLMLEGGQACRDPAQIYESGYVVHGVSIEKTVERLPPRHAMLIRAHYFGGVSFSDIAASWGLSRGRVSQLHSSALKKLRGMMESSATDAATSTVGG